MRSGDRIRLLQIGLYGAAAPMAVFTALALATGRVSLWWVVPAGVACGVFTAWMAHSFFGIAHLEALAAHVVHGGRHYYFDHEEIRVLFDENGDAWLRLADIRRCVGGDPRVLRHYAAHETTVFADERRQPYLSDAGVRRWLATSRHAGRARFLLWYERDFLLPLQARRERGLPLHGTGSGRP